MNHTRAVTIALLKQASKAEAAGKGIAKGLESAYNVAKKVVSSGAGAGKGAFEHAGLNPEAGKVLGGALAAYGAYRGVRGATGLAQGKIDEFRIRHGLYPNVGY